LHSATLSEKHTALLFADGTLKAWLEDRPIDLSGCSDSFLAMAAGFASMYALDSSDQLWSWSWHLVENSKKQQTPLHDTPTRFSGLPRISRAMQSEYGSSGRLITKVFIFTFFAG
jgi:hypothetical protein